MFWKKSFFAKSLFFRLMTSFLLIIVIASSLFVVSFSLYFSNMQQQLVSNTKERFAITCNQFDYGFEKVTDTLYRLYSDDYFKPVLSNKKLTYFDMMQLKNLMLRYVSMNETINSIFLLSDNSDLILSSQGTFQKTEFFGKFLYSGDYSLAFWDGEKAKKFYYTFYNPGKFDDLTDPKTYHMELMPVAFKQSSNAGFIMVALVDVSRIASGVGSDFLKNFVILGPDKQLFYSGGDLEDVVAGLAREGTGRAGGGFLLQQPSQQKGITYYRYLPGTELRQTIVQSSAAILVILAVTILFSVILSFLISRHTNNLAKKIVEIMSGAASAGQAGGDTDLMHIRTGIQRLVAQNSQYSDDIRARDLVLEDFFYRTKIKNVHVPLSEPGGQHTILDNYFLACFTLHYLEVYFEKTGADQSMGTYRLKDLLDGGIKAYYKSCITFQSENNQIVSIINADSSASDLPAAEVLARVLDSLREEEPFVFFTAALSGIKRDILELDAVYKSMLSLSKYRKLAERNQILTEGCRELQEGKFYFSLAQAEHFSEYLSNGRLTECIQQIDEILDINLKNNVGNFHFQLLCTEIVNCAARVLSGQGGDLPPDLDINGVYSRLEQCWKLEQFKSVCKNFTITVSERIKTVEKSKEYIVDYIKEYVENHYSEDIYLDLLAEKLHLSKVYISLHFKNKTGINFSDWLNDYRMKKAVELLNGTTMKVQEIGRSVGCNANTFIRAFKKYSGQTPSEYRQARLNQ